MPFEAKAYKVLIGSPTDVQQEREAAFEAVRAWNADSSQIFGRILVPVAGGRDASPQTGDRPQEFINQQLVDACDFVIALFWTRLGTPTGQAKSGTVEEIERALKQNKPVLMYFSSAAVPQKMLDSQQWHRLEEFKQEYKDKALWETYTDTNDLRQKLNRHLTFQMGKIQEQEQTLSSFPPNVPEQSLEPFEQRQIAGTGAILYYYSPTQKENILEYLEVNFGGEANKATTGKATASSTHPKLVQPQEIIEGPRTGAEWGLNGANGSLQVTWESSITGQYVLFNHRRSTLGADSWGGARIFINDAEIARLKYRFSGQMALLIDLTNVMTISKLYIDIKGANNPGLTGLEIY